MVEQGTIAAISTAQGSGGIGVIRISGKGAIEIADKLFFSRGGKKLAELNGYQAAFGHIKENNETIDEAVALVFKAPHSYTGENVVELSCHGGVYITKRVLRAVLKAGAGAAEAGEFTKRAFLNGKLDLTEAEAVMDIISAKGAASAKAAVYCKEGSVSKKINSMKKELIHTAAHLSAWADYPEEDIPQVTTGELNKTLISCLTQTQDLLLNYDMGKTIKEGVETIIVGKPNVGKSTLMNVLSGSEKSIVTDIPGTTRDIVEETVVLGNITLRLSDTAGLRETDNPVEKIGVDRAKQRMESGSLVLAVFDGSSSLTKEDEELIEKMRTQPCIAIINKTDKPIKLDEEKIKGALPYVVQISAKEESGINKLIDYVEKLTNTKHFDPSAAVLATERQYNCALRAQNALQEAKNALELGMTLDAVTVSLEDAIACLLELTGERASEVVVENVFARFCVGK